MLYRKILYDIIKGRFVYTRIFDFYKTDTKNVTSEFINEIRENILIEVTIPT